MPASLFAKLVFTGLAFFMLPASAESTTRRETSWNLGAGAANGFIDSTYLLSIRQGSSLSRQVSSLRNQGYESAVGSQIGFDRWYSTRWTDLRVLWMSQIDKRNGLVWGLSTGEYGEKYLIQPALTLGLIHQHELGKDGVVTLYGTAVIGGRLKEKSCTADYGEIGGVQEVNCRLAASILPPADTLRYLMNERPREDMQLLIRYAARF